MVQDIYHYADIQYSDEYKAITFSEVRSALMYGGQIITHWTERS